MRCFKFSPTTGLWSLHSEGHIEHAGAAPLQVGLIVHREVLHSILKIQKAEMPTPDKRAAQTGEQLSDALEHLHADVV